MIQFNNRLGNKTDWQIRKSAKQERFLEKLHVESMAWLVFLVLVAAPLLSVAFPLESLCQGSPWCVPIDLASAPLDVRQRQTPPEVLQLGLQSLFLLSHFLPLTHQLLTNKGQTKEEEK